MPSYFDPRLSITSNPAAPEVLVLQFLGLFDYPNQFSQGVIPLAAGMELSARPAQGGLLAANNCVIERPGVVDSRRGFGLYGNTDGTPSQGLSFACYDNGRLCHFDDNIIRVDNGAGRFVALSNTHYYAPGTYAGSRVRFVEQNGNLYFNSNNGIFKISSLNSAPVLAGGPQALAGSVVSVNTSANTGPLPNNSSVAYRSLWEYTDENSNLIRGVPSNPLIANNANLTNNASVTLSFTVPTTVDDTWTFRVYRSNYGMNPSPPDDNCQLVYSVQPNTAQITARTITFTDNVADTQRGETLYTTAQGVANSEYRPPVAQDLALYKGCMFYGNCKTYQQLILTLQTDGVLQAGDNLTFWQGNTALFAIFGGASEDAANGIFKISSGSTAAIDIDETAQSICNVVNYVANNTMLDAYYQSVINVSQPGTILFQYRAYNDDPFYVTCSNTSNPALFTPGLPSTGNSVNNLSTDTNNQHYVYFSKSLQPEAVPLNYWFAVGSKLTPILRLIALRDVLFIIKSDGVYAIVGNDPSTFQVSPLDVQQNIAGVNTPAVLNNYLYFLGQQGLVQMDESGNHQIISLPIQQSLMQYTTNVYPNFASASWALAYQAAHKYILFTVASPSDEVAQQAFVYDWTTSAWTRWDRPFTSGNVDPVLGTMWATGYESANAQIYQERKNLDDTDYVDEQYGVTLTAANGTVVTVQSIPSKASVGDVLYQAPYYSTISALDSTNNLITVEDTISWNANTSPANVCVPIAVDIQTSPIYGNDPTQQGQFPEFSIIADGTSGASFNVAFTTDGQQSNNNLQLTVPTTKGTVYGTGTYGVGTYGGVVYSYSASRLRSYIPMATQKCNWIMLNFTTNSGFSRVGFTGLQLVYRPLSVRQR